MLGPSGIHTKGDWLAVWEKYKINVLKRMLLSSYLGMKPRTAG